MQGHPRGSRLETILNGRLRGLTDSPARRDAVFPIRRIERPERVRWPFFLPCGLASGLAFVSNTGSPEGLG
jgi:hypothetical protein